MLVSRLLFKGTKKNLKSVGKPLNLLQVTQPLDYVGTLLAIRINESMAEWTARDCYVSLLAALPPFSSIKLLHNCPIFLNNVSKTKFTNIIYMRAPPTHRSPLRSNYMD
jgi:hypothetical protein